MFPPIPARSCFFSRLLRFTCLFPLFMFPRSRRSKREVILPSGRSRAKRESFEPGRLVIHSQDPLGPRLGYAESVSRYKVARTWRRVSRFSSEKREIPVNYSFRITRERDCAGSPSARFGFSLGKERASRPGGSQQAAVCRGI